MRQFVQVGTDAVGILAVGTPEQNRQLFAFAKDVSLIFINIEPVDDLATMPANTVYVGSGEQQSGTLQMKELLRLNAPSSSPDRPVIPAVVILCTIYFSALSLSD